MLAASVGNGDEKSDDSILSFRRVASASDAYSSLYHRDLPFLLDASIQISEYNLALDIGKNACSHSVRATRDLN
jgi:hypothetical protein